MRKITAAAIGMICLVGTLGSPIAAHAATAQAKPKANWTFEVALTPDEDWNSKVISLPDGRYRVTGTDLTEPFACDPDYTGCDLGELERCRYSVAIIRAVNKGFSPGGVLNMDWPNSSTPPPSSKSREFMHTNTDNQKYYLDVTASIGPSIDPPATCNFRINLKKVR